MLHVAFLAVCVVVVVVFAAYGMTSWVLERRRAARAEAAFATDGR